MQLTRLDRWLREKFVLETHVETMRVPAAMPRSAHHEELPESAGRKFKHLFVLRRDKDLDAFIHTLKMEGLMFKTKVVARKAWFVPYLAPPNGRSVTWWVVGKIVLFFSFIGIVRLGFHFWDNPEIRQNILESFQILKK